MGTRKSGLSVVYGICYDLVALKELHNIVQNKCFLVKLFSTNVHTSHYLTQRTETTVL